MQLKLSVGDEMLTIDVKPTDTFQDISERLCSLGNIKVDMNQLRSSNNDKPFDMSTNVIEYFTKSAKTQVVEDRKHLQKTDVKSTVVCRLCGEAIISISHFLFDSRTKTGDLTLADKVNSALPIFVSKKDSYPKQVCDNCLSYLDKSYDFMRMVVEAQNILESRVKPGEPIRHTHRDERCPLCNNGHLRCVNKKSGPVNNSRRNPTERGVTVQVPRAGAIRRDLIGHKRSRTEDEISGPEYYFNDEVVTGYWEPRHSSFTSSTNSIPDSLSSLSSSKKYRKRIKSEDDQDWTIDEEYIPISRRGRPKGTKNKPKVMSIIKKRCVLCDWTGADLDMLAHTINVHCQPDLGYFPCPMCKTRHANEMILELHIEEHNTAARKNK